MPIHPTDSGPIYYELRGSGEPVVLIHGVGVMGKAWEPQVKGWGGKYLTLQMDNRGIGNSQPSTGTLSIEGMAKDVCALMDQVAWKSAHLVGHSMGGLIAQQVALESPNRVRSLSLLCTFSEGPEAARLTPWVLWMTLRTRIGSKAMRRRAFLEMLLSKADLAASDKPMLVETFAKLLGRDLADQPAVLMRQLMAMGRHRIFSRLAELGGIPTLVISGSEDKIALPKYGERLARAIPGAEFENWPAASHGLTIYKEQAINERLDLFFQRVEANGL